MRVDMPVADHVAVRAEDQAAVEAELRRITSSPVFRGSRRCCRFLEYSVNQVLQQTSPGDLRERSIGIAVFQRPPNYDTAEDAVVRVTANEVRKRLAQYYQLAGPEANPVISLPAGSYAVTFVWRPRVVAPPPETEIAAPTRPGVPIRWVWAALAVMVLAAAVAGFYAARRPEPAAQSDNLWSLVFRPGQKTNIIMADAAKFEIQELLRRDISLREYLSTDFPMNLIAGASPELQGVIRFMGTRETTSVGSAALGSSLLQFGAHRGVQPVFRHPRHVNVREFETDNFIMLGSRLSIPWMELFEPSLNFPMKIDPVTREFYLENRGPRPGEPARYVRSRADEVTYADVALLPNLARTGTVLLFNAIDMLGVEAAGEFAMNGSLGTRQTGTEVLLRIRSVGGAPSKTEIVAVRETLPSRVK